MTSKWQSVPLSTVAVIRPAKKEVQARLAPDDAVTFMPMEDLPVKGGAVSGVKSKPLRDVYSSYTYFADNDVLLAKITPCFENGKIGVATNLQNGVGFGSSEFMVIRCGSQVDPNFLYYFLSQDSIVDAGSLVMTGSVGHRRVPQVFIENLAIPLPPLDEQKRIVAKLDEAMSDLNLIEQQTSEMGDLAALFTSAVSSEEFAVTSKWSSLPLRTVASIRPAKKEVLNRLVQEDEVTFMPMEDLPVKGGPVSGVRSKPLKEVYSSYTYFADNDVLLAKITPCFENGKIGVATNLHNGVGFGSSEFMVIRCGEQVDPYFLYYFLSQDSIVDAGSLVMTGSVGHRRVPQTFIENLQIPLPPLNEQKRIVAKLDEISKCSYMWKALQNRRTESRVKLKSAVLAAAFAGEL